MEIINQKLKLIQYKGKEYGWNKITKNHKPLFENINYNKREKNNSYKKRENNDNRSSIVNRSIQDKNFAENLFFSQNLLIEKNLSKHDNTFENYKKNEKSTNRKLKNKNNKKIHRNAAAIRMIEIIDGKEKIIEENIKEEDKYNNSKFNKIIEVQLTDCLFKKNENESNNQNKFNMEEKGITYEKSIKNHDEKLKSEENNDKNLIEEIEEINQLNINKINLEKLRSYFDKLKKFSQNVNLSLNESEKQNSFLPENEKSINYNNFENKSILEKISINKNNKEISILSSINQKLNKSLKKNEENQTCEKILPEKDNIFLKCDINENCITSSDKNNNLRLAYDKLNDLNIKKSEAKKEKKAENNLNITADNHFEITIPAAYLKNHNLNNKKENNNLLNYFSDMSIVNNPSKKENTTLNTNFNGDIIYNNIDSLNQQENSKNNFINYSPQYLFNNMNQYHDFYNRYLQNFYMNNNQNHFKEIQNVNLNTGYNPTNNSIFNNNMNYFFSNNSNSSNTNYWSNIDLDSMKNYGIPKVLFNQFNKEQGNLNNEIEGNSLNDINNNNLNEKKNINNSNTFINEKVSYNPPIYQNGYQNFIYFENQMMPQNLYYMNYKSYNPYNNNVYTDFYKFQGK